jgi:hypothetical protein
MRRGMHLILQIRGALHSAHPATRTDALRPHMYHAVDTIQPSAAAPRYVVGAAVICITCQHWHRLSNTFARVGQKSVLKDHARLA